MTSAAGPDHRRSASIIARGVVCAFGSGQEALWEGLLSGQGKVAPWRGADGLELRGARVPEDCLDSSALRADRTLALVREATRQISESDAWQSAEGFSPQSVGVCVGTTQGALGTWQRSQALLAQDPAHRPPWPGLADPALTVARLLDAGGPVECPSVACASGALAIGLGLSWLRRGLCEAVVAGGVDALSEFIYSGFACLKALDPERPRPFDRDRAGLGLGEAAVLVLLRLGEHDGATLVAGSGLSGDANHLTGPDRSGAGVARAMEAALADAGLCADDLDHVNAHGTATVYNDLMESKALARVLGSRVQKLPVTSVKGATGHTMGAAGALEAVVTALTLERGLVPPTCGLRNLDPEINLDVVQDRPRPGVYRRALTSNSGFGGINAALVLCRPG